jgi:hypothetical protein
MSVLLEGLLPLTAAIVAVLGSAFTVLVDWAKEKWRKRFREQLKAAVARETLTYTDLQHVAERWSQDRQAVLQALRVLLSEAVAGEDPALTEKAQFIRQLLGVHQSREPYAELPENISLQLAAISPALASQPNTVPQLAASLSDLYSKNQRELARQKKLAIWGFVVGLLGLLASMPGIYALFKT